MATVWIEGEKVCIDMEAEPLSLESAEGLAAKILLHCGIIRTKRIASEALRNLSSRASNLQREAPGGSGKPKRWKK